MAEENDESLIHRQSFQRFINQQAQKKNTILFTADDLVKVDDFLSGKEVPISSSLKRRTQRNSFVLKSFAGDPDVVCVFERCKLHNVFFKSFILFFAGVPCNSKHVLGVASFIQTYSKSSEIIFPYWLHYVWLSLEFL